MCARSPFQQKPEHGEGVRSRPPPVVKGVSALVDPDGNESVKWIKTSQDAERTRRVQQRAVVEGFKDELPRRRSRSISRAAAATSIC